jgi:hypothetical protein
MDAIADKFRRDRFRFNTRTLLDEPRQSGQDHIAVPRRSTRCDGGALDVHEHHLFDFFRLCDGCLDSVRNISGHGRNFPGGKPV